MNRSDDCPDCGGPLTRVTGGPNPRTARIEFVTEPCNHVIAAHEAWEALEAGIPQTVTPVNGATLAQAERRRQLGEEGYTPEDDAGLTDLQLSWAVWAILDRVHNPTSDAPPPNAWPFPAERFPRDKSPVRLLVIATAMLEAEIDRRLAEGERP